MSALVPGPRTFVTSRATANRYLAWGYGVLLGGGAVVAGLAALASMFGWGVGATVGTVAVILFVGCQVVGGLTAYAGHLMARGRWGLHLGDAELTVVKGSRRTAIPFTDLEFFAVRPWGKARELQVKFRPEVLPPRGITTGRAAGPGRTATDLSILFQVNMLGEREAEFLAALARHLPQRR